MSPRRCSVLFVISNLHSMILFLLIRDIDLLMNKLRSNKAQTHAFTFCFRTWGTKNPYFFAWATESEADFNRWTSQEERMTKIFSINLFFSSYFEFPFSIHLHHTNCIVVIKMPLLQQHTSYFMLGARSILTHLTWNPSWQRTQCRISLLLWPNIN